MSILKQKVKGLFLIKIQINFCKIFLICISPRNCCR